jgi:DNA-binding transcriptional regulator PaaX
MFSAMLTADRPSRDLRVSLSVRPDELHQLPARCWHLARNNSTARRFTGRWRPLTAFSEVTP